MAAACSTRLPHSRPGKAVSIGPHLLIRTAYFAANQLYQEAVPLSATGGCRW